MDIIYTAEGATPMGALVAIDRQERGSAELSAIQEIERDYGVSVVSVVKLDDIVTYIEQRAGFQKELERIKSYREQFGVAA